LTEFFFPHNFVLENEAVPHTYQGLYSPP